MVETYLQKLIREMSDNTYRIGEEEVEGIFDSDKTVGASAYEEARNISNDELMPELFEIIINAESRDVRHNAYFILGYNAKNLKHLDGTIFLLKCLKSEKDRMNLVTILTSLADLFKPATLDTSYIVKLTEHKNPLVRGAAYEALANNENEVEDFYLQRLGVTQNKHDIRPLLSSLMYVGTSKSIPYIEKYLKSRDSFVKVITINILTVIMLRAEYPFQEIHKKLKVSMEFVQHHFDRLDILSKPG